MTKLERAIASQPAELERLSRADWGELVRQIEAKQRVWLVGTGSSAHVAQLGALMLTEAGLDARSCGSLEFVRSVATPEPTDAVIVISHTARSSFAAAARAAALAAGALVVAITGIGGGWPEAIETVKMEESQTYTVSVTAALVLLLRLAHQLGVSAFSPERLKAAVERVRVIVNTPETPAIEPPSRALLLAGSGAAAVSAREGALKLREAARVLAEGYDGEYLLHGGAVPLHRGDAMLVIGAGADRDGLLPGSGQAAQAEGLNVAYLDEPSIEHPILAQLPIIVRLQRLALHYSQTLRTDPDQAITGHWADEALWAIGRPPADPT